MSNIKVVVTGAKGQLGKDFMSILRQANYEVFGFAKDELDITDLTKVKATMNKIKPDIIVHAAAYTKVDLSEKEPDLAFLINGIGTKNIALAASELESKLVYISTDYVFNGKSEHPYNEWDTPDPLNVYAKTKLAGEQFVRMYHHKYFIVRTSWVFGENGQNFVKSMLRTASKGGPISVVNDQIGSPTYTVDLINAILAVMESNQYGIYHISNSGSCSWYELAKAIFEEVGLSVDLKPCTTDQFSSLAKRPKYSVLNHSLLKANGFSEMRHWKEALQVFTKGFKKIKI